MFSTVIVKRDPKCTTTALATSVVYMYYKWRTNKLEMFETLLLRKAKVLDDLYEVRITVDLPW